MVRSTFVFVIFFTVLLGSYNAFAQSSLCRSGELQLDFTQKNRANIRGVVYVPSKGYVYSLVVKPHTTGDVLEGVLNIVDTRPNFVRPEEVVALEIAQNVGIPAGSVFMRIDVVAGFRESPRLFKGQFSGLNSFCLKPDFSEFNIDDAQGGSEAGGN